MNCGRCRHQEAGERSKEKQFWALAIGASGTLRDLGPRTHPLEKIQLHRGAMELWPYSSTAMCRWARSDPGGPPQPITPNVGEGGEVTRTPREAGTLKPFLQLLVENRKDGTAKTCTRFVSGCWTSKGIWSGARNRLRIINRFKFLLN